MARARVPAGDLSAMHAVYTHVSLNLPLQRQQQSCIITTDRFAASASCAPRTPHPLPHPSALYLCLPFELLRLVAPQVQRVCYSTCSIHTQENEDVVAKALDRQPAPPPTPTPGAAGEARTVQECATSPAAEINVPPCSDGGGGSKVGVSPADAVNERALAVPTANENGGGGVIATSGRFKLSRCLSRWPRRGLAVSGLNESQAACMVRTDPSEDETNGFFVALFEREGCGVARSGSEGTTGEAKKQRRNRHKNRKKKNNRKRKREEEGKEAGEDSGRGEVGGEGTVASR